MKQKKLRGYVLPTIYVLVLMLVFGAVSLVSSFMRDSSSYLYSIGILNKDSIPVVEVPSTVIEGIIRPYTSEHVSIDKYFYDMNDTEEKQLDSLIYFKNTYMKNTGVLYKAQETFDCVAVLNGTVLNVREDDVLGKVVEIEHNTNLRTIYYSLSEVSVKVGDTINQGDVVGVSGTNSLTENTNNLLFEVYYNGTILNPETFYSMEPDAFN